MTTQPDPAPTGQKPARQLVEPLRETAAIVLLGANAVLLFVAVLDLLASTTGVEAFSSRAAYSFGNFVNLYTIGFPLIAVLLAAFVAPALPKAKLIVTVALVELAVSAVLGVFFGLLFGLAGLLDNSILALFTGFLARVAWLAVLGLVLFGVWSIYQGNYYTPRPKPVPGMYGQPGAQYPGQPYPGQQPYQQQPPQYGYPPQQQYGAPYGDPQHYGQQTTALPVQPPAGSPAAPQQQPYQPAPQSGPPHQAPQYPAPQSAPPQSGPPQSGPPSSSVPPHVQPPAPQGPPPGYPQGPPPGYEQTQRNTDDR
ncbi:hypothetical protein ACIA8K_09360 [Catenuloplanes sp. NPDC051500]|uniref:hypothetical protein n=1 Tax=Catenuloplanes sp. NPDC051500 TaxID=3363959 RepID=UPI0037B4C666